MFLCERGDRQNLDETHTSPSDYDWFSRDTDKDMWWIRDTTYREHQKLVMMDCYYGVTYNTLACVRFSVS